jgi:hypothetical protein
MREIIRIVKLFRDTLARGMVDETPSMDPIMTLEGLSAAPRPAPDQWRSTVGDRWEGGRA